MKTETSSIMTRVKLGLACRPTGLPHSLLKKDWLKSRSVSCNCRKVRLGRRCRRASPALSSQDTPNAMLERVLKYLSFMLLVPNAESSVLSVFLGRTHSLLSQLSSPLPGLSSLSGQGTPQWRSDTLKGPQSPPQGRKCQVILKPQTPPGNGFIIIFFGMEGFWNQSF